MTIRNRLTAPPRWRSAASSTNLRLLTLFAALALLSGAVVACDRTPDVIVPDAAGLTTSDYQFLSCLDRLGDWGDWGPDGIEIGEEVAMAVYCTELVLNHPEKNNGNPITEPIFAGGVTYGGN